MPVTDTSKDKIQPAKAPVVGAIPFNYSFFRKIMENHYFFLTVLVLIYMLMLSIVNPIGNFPLNDDWIFAHPVYSLLTSGKYGDAIRSAPILISQVLWGLLFCIFTGFSFTTLRISTLILGIAGIIMMYFLFFNLSKNKRLSFLVALLLLVNPLYFSLSNTFMTDVPFASFTLFSIYFYFKSWDTKQRKFKIIATIFSIIAVLIRQFGILIPLGYALTCSIRQPQTLQQRLKHFIPLLITFIAYETAVLWLKHIGSEPNNIPYLTLLNFFDDPKYWTLEVIRRVGSILFYFGLLFFPLLILLKINLKSLKSRIAYLLIILCIVGLFILFYRIFPGENILKNGYIGPKLISVYECNTYHSNTDKYHENFPDSILFLLYIIGIAGVALFFIHLSPLFSKLIHGLKSTSNKNPDNKYIFITLFTLGYILALLFTAWMFDRYFILVFIFFSLLVIPDSQNKWIIPLPLLIFTSIFVLVIALFTAFGTHDYLAWNRARWQAVDYLTKNQNISMHKIDAGYETNGWLLGFDGRKPDYSKIFVGIIDGEEYMLTFGELDGYQPLNKFPYTSYFPPHKRYVYAMYAVYDLFNEGINLIKKGKSDSADIIIKRFQEDAKGKLIPHLHNYIGMLYAGENKLREAEQEFKTEISLNLQKGEAFYQLGKIYYSNKDADSAINAFDSTVILNPTNADAYNYLGACYLSFKNDSKKAQDFFKKTTEVNPDFIQGYINLLICSLNNKDEESFIKYTKLLLHKGMSIKDIKAKGVVIPDALVKRIT